MRHSRRPTLEFQYCLHLYDFGSDELWSHGDSFDSPIPPSCRHYKRQISGFGNYGKIFIFTKYYIYSAFKSYSVTNNNFESFCEALNVYRAVTVFNDLHNAAFSSTIVPTIKFLGILGLYVSFFAVTVLRSRIHPFLQVAFLIYVITLVLIMLPGAQAMSQVYVNSMRFHQKLESSLEKISGSNELKKNVKSLQLLKSRIGGLYHMEGKAKLTLVDNIARGIAFMMVTFKK